jgi:chemotaxis protein CheC
LQLDALREVANIGGGHAATAFSKLVGGRTVRIEVPLVLFAPVADLPAMVHSADYRLVSISFEMIGQLTGIVVLVLPEEDAHALCTLLLGSESKGELSETQLSALCEAGNIVASACLAAIATFTGLKILPSAPSLSQSRQGDLILKPWLDLDPSGSMVVMQIQFTTATTPRIRGQLILLPETRSLATLLSRLGL